MPHSYLVDCEVVDGCQVGPFAYSAPAPASTPAPRRAAFVEIKNSRSARARRCPTSPTSAMPRSAPGSNLGAGTVTANYDGFRKHRTVIGDQVRIGVDTMLIAPVQVGDRAYTGAGAVVKGDVPEGALAVSDNDQRNIEGYADEKAGQMREEEDE